MAEELTSCTTPSEPSERDQLLEEVIAMESFADEQYDKENEEEVIEMRNVHHGKWGKGVWKPWVKHQNAWNNPAPQVKAREMNVWKR